APLAYLAAPGLGTGGRDQGGRASVLASLTAVELPHVAVEGQGRAAMPASVIGLAHAAPSRVWRPARPGRRRRGRRGCLAHMPMLGADSDRARCTKTYGAAAGPSHNRCTVPVPS